jgi:CRP/FNR family cyclic AMP-dependent transcriptional regulator
MRRFTRVSPCDEAFAAAIYGPSMMKICDDDCNLGYIARLFLPHRSNGTDTLLAKREAATVCAQFGWLSRTPEVFRNELIDRAAVRRAEANETVYLAGDEPSGLLGLVSGTIRIELVTSGAEPQVAFIGRPGFWFGETAVLRRKSRIITATAAGDSVLLQLSTAAFEEMAQDLASMRQFAILAVENLELALRIIAILLTRDPMKRVASSLLTIAGETDQSVVHVNQADLATMCALTRKTVNEILATLKSAGVLTVGYKEIEILSRARLAAIGAGSTSA